jgi:hypothetical protein
VLVVVVVLAAVVELVDPVPRVSEHPATRRPPAHTARVQTTLCITRPPTSEFDIQRGRLDGGPDSRGAIVEKQKIPAGGRRFSG